MDNDLHRDIEERDARCAWGVIIGLPDLQCVAAAATKTYHILRYVYYIYQKFMTLTVHRYHSSTTHLICYNPRRQF